MHREMDLAILQEALAREAAEEAAEVAAREAKRQATLHYRMQLAAMMAKQEADQGEEEARVDAINRQQQAKREAEWAARDAARRKLMAEVEQIRQEQIARKQHERCALCHSGLRAPAGRTELFDLVATAQAHQAAVGSVIRE
jgi:hypothetical protein